MALYFRQFIVIVAQGSPTTPPFAPPPLPPRETNMEIIRPVKPSTFGKQFGKDHIRWNSQRSLLVRCPANAVNLPVTSMQGPPPHGRLQKLIQPIVGCNDRLGSLDTSYCVLDRNLTDVPNVKINMDRQQLYLNSSSIALSRRRQLSFRSASRRVATLIMHMHANTAMRCGCYAPRKLHYFQGVKRIVKAWTFSHGPLFRHRGRQGLSLDLLQMEPHCSYQTASSIVSKINTS